MAATKFVSCKDHGGQFKVPVKRGRSPVRCTETNPCSRAEEAQQELAERVVQAAPQQVAKAVERIEAGIPRTSANPSLAPAKAAKERLVSLGWTVQGKGGGTWASVSASRGQETLIMNWLDGEIRAQEYSLFNPMLRNEEVTAERESSLGFNPDELTDGELVDRIRGMKVQWWNSLGSSVERAIIGTKVSIEHIFDTADTRDDSKRLVKFIDHSGGGFRAFHVSALLKVG